MKKLMFAALVSCFSVSAFAACTDSQQQCVIYKNGKVSVNKKPGAKAANSNASGMGLTCYAADADKQEQFCSTNY